MTIGPAPACCHCKHFLGVRDSGAYCAAFPKGIPIPIFYEGKPHTEPVDGDNGLQFEPEDAGKKK